MPLDEVLKLLFFVPVALRRPMALAIVLLLSFAEVLNLRSEYGTWEAVQTTPWLAALCAFAVLMAVCTLWSRKKLRPWQIWTWGAAYLALGAFGGYRAYIERDAQYNDIGYFHSHAWSLSATQPADSGVHRFEWHMRAIKDLSQTPLFVELGRTDACRFTQFFPTSASSEYTPAITDMTVDARSSSRWRIQNFRKPALLRFLLELPAGDVPDEACIPRTTTGNSK